MAHELISGGRPENSDGILCRCRQGCSFGLVLDRASHLTWEDVTRPIQGGILAEGLLVGGQVWQVVAAVGVCAAEIRKDVATCAECMGPQ